MEAGRVVSAPGKIILAGEHAVVYGYPAIVAAIDRRLTVQLVGRKTRVSGLVQYALKLLNYAGGVEIRSALPIGSGLGSSAAVATALVWAIKPRASLAEKNLLVKKIEDYQHGQSSGVDQTIVREGGFLRFQKGQFRKITLPLKQVILIDSGQPRESTGEMVKLVAQGSWQKEFRQIGALVDDWSPEKISLNEKILETIGVVGDKAKKVIRRIEASGGAAKICGAGGVKAGSGMILAYHSNQARLVQLITQSGWRYLKVNLGAPGVRDEG